MPTLRHDNIARRAARLFRHILPCLQTHTKPRHAPYGNLTAALLLVAFLELVVDRLLGRLFLAPGCQAGWSCLWLRAGPLLLNLTGLLALMVGAGGIAGHLRRGELFPRGVRFTVAALSLVFLLLLAVSLLLGQMPGRFQVHLETSFSFVVGLLALSVVGSMATSARARVGFLLFALPGLLHVAALVFGRRGWIGYGLVKPEQLTLAGELTLLLAAAGAPLLLLPREVPRQRLAAGLALAAGVGAFFFVAFVGRTDLVQTLVFYSVRLELPRALTVLGLWYVVALFGFLTTAGVLLLTPGASRLAGMGMCLLGVGGYETSSPVGLSISLCGLLALATGALRAGRESGAGGRPGLSPPAWRELLGTVAAGVADSPTTETEPISIAVTAGPVAAASDSDAAASDTSNIRAPRRGRSVEIEIGRGEGVPRRLTITTGTPPATEPEAVIEGHETWIARRPEDRPNLPRQRTGDLPFDRALGVHGRVSLDDRVLRRRLLGLADGTITLWPGRAARFTATAPPGHSLRRFSATGSAAVARATVEVVDVLLDLLATSAPPPPAAG